MAVKKQQEFEIKSSKNQWQVTRRTFLKASVGTVTSTALWGLAGGCDSKGQLSSSKQRTMRFGMVTDTHYADADPNGSRFYRETPAKLSECVELMNTQKVDFLIELGDFKDQDRKPNEQNTLEYLKKIEGIFQTFNGPKYHVLGNHDMDSISKPQYLECITNTGIARDRSYYSFDKGGVHFVVFDANYNSDGSDYDHGNFDWTDSNIPAAQIDWLTADLAATKLPTICFSHQLYDGSGIYYVKNAPQVRQVFQDSAKVVAVFQGHYHEGDYNQIEGIHYYTLKAVIEGSGVENNAYAVVEVDPQANITVVGYRKAVSKELSAAVVAT